MNLIPCSAIVSRLGVLCFFEPKQPISPYPRSSQKIMMKLGISVFWVCGSAFNSVWGKTAAARVVAVKLRNFLRSIGRSFMAQLSL